MKFTIITASFNAGDKLIETVKNALSQSCTDFEILVKDGGSADDSVERLLLEPEAKAAADCGRLRIIVRQDRSVYDGMNQAIEESRGEYLIFLNCGDRFHDEKVLERTLQHILAAEEAADQTGSEAGGKSEKEESATEKNVGNTGSGGLIIYGDTCHGRTGALITSARRITGFTCYRNIPCHQACFYSRVLFDTKKYDTDLKIRADYDHFLWCFYRGNARFTAMNLVVADYEGGGISETRSNMETDRREHELVIRRYMSGTEIFRYKMILLLTLAPLRRAMAESRCFSGFYHGLKKVVYGMRSGASRR